MDDPGRVPDILIVDDDVSVGRVHQRLLERAGYTVTAVDNGLAALAELQQHTFGAILLDVRMPFLEGRRFYEEVANTYPELAERVIFVTGFADDPQVRDFLRGVGRPVLLKPVEFEELVTAVQHIARPAPRAPRLGSQIRVLVADDDAIVRKTIRRFLVAAGYEVSEAADGAGALQALRAEPPVDLLITDIYMPGMDGMELAIRARQEGTLLHVLVMSGGGYMAREDVLKRAQKLGAARTLGKPFTGEELLAAVEEALRTNA